MRGIGFPRPTPPGRCVEADTPRPTSQAGALRPTPQQNSCDKLYREFLSSRCIHAYNELRNNERT